MPLTAALIGGATVGLLWPVVLAGMTMGGSYVVVDAFQVVAISAVVLAVGAQLCLQGPRRPGAVVAHIIGMVGGILSLLLIDAVWPRLALDQAVFAASHAPRIVPSAIRIETAFAVIACSVTVAVVMSLIVSLVQLGTYRPIADRDPG